MCSKIGSGSARLLDFPSLQVELLICLIDFLIGMSPDLIVSLKLSVTSFSTLRAFPFKGWRAFGSLLISLAHRQLSCDEPDCGSSIPDSSESSEGLFTTLRRGASRRKFLPPNAAVILLS